jgi:hypothetical protein
MLDQLRVAARDLGVARRARMLPVLPQERRKARQRREVVIRVDPAVEAIADERPKIVGKAVRIDAFALDQPAVAERGFLSRAASVEQGHAAAALLQMDRDADSHDPGAEHDDVAAHTSYCF